jgi:hypothetical protein
LATSTCASPPSPELNQWKVSIGDLDHHAHSLVQWTDDLFMHRRPSRPKQVLAESGDTSGAVRSGHEHAYSPGERTWFKHVPPSVVHFEVRQVEQAHQLKIHPDRSWTRTIAELINTHTTEALADRADLNRSHIHKQSVTGVRSQKPFAQAVTVQAPSERIRKD